MKGFLLLFFLHAVLVLSAQQPNSDWENYIVSLNGKPVSVNVDLGLSAVAPIPERPYVIIFRLQLGNSDANGMPLQQDMDSLVNLENRLVELLARQNGALFAGRFTQRGIREFYFYAPDTIDYHRAMNQSMLPLPGYKWLGQAKLDEKWDNYFNVLYPSALDQVTIQSRRRLEAMYSLGLELKKPMDVQHFFSFPEAERRKKFLMGLGNKGMVIVSMPPTADQKSGQFSLVLSKSEQPNLVWVQQQVIPLYQKALRSGGAYLGWDLESSSVVR